MGLRGKAHCAELDHDVNMEAWAILLLVLFHGFPIKASSMAVPLKSLISSSSSSSLSITASRSFDSSTAQLILSSPIPYFGSASHQVFLTTRSKTSNVFIVAYRMSANRHCEDDEDSRSKDFREAVALFNKGDFYECHNVLESMWFEAEEPVRTLIHGILQCAVGLHHLFNQNHKGAMMELGEGLCKLRRNDYASDPFLQFGQEISALLEFIYQTQIELAACADDTCLMMEQSEKSYKLLGGYGAGQPLYSWQIDPSDATSYIVFTTQRSYGSGEPLKVKLPVLNATEEHLMDL